MEGREKDEGSVRREERWRCNETMRRPKHVKDRK
jgi:hypothetical protein